MHTSQKLAGSGTPDDPLTVYSRSSVTQLPVVPGGYGAGVEPLKHAIPGFTLSPAPLMMVG